MRCVHARRVPSHSCWYAALATDEERTGSAWEEKRERKRHSREDAVRLASQLFVGRGRSRKG